MSTSRSLHSLEFCRGMKTASHTHEEFQPHRVKHANLVTSSKTTYPVKKALISFLVAFWPCFFTGLNGRSKYR